MKVLGSFPTQQPLVEDVHQLPHHPSLYKDAHYEFLFKKPFYDVIISSFITPIKFFYLATNVLFFKVRLKA